ncbi:MAG: ATP-binding protein [Acidimicrobiales bacterium]
MIRLRSASWRLGLALGIVGVVGVSVVSWAVRDHVTEEIPALVLLIPIVAVSALWGLRAGLPVAVVAAVVHAFTLIPPIGSVRLGYTQDTLVLVTFAAVAMVVSLVASRRSVLSQAQLIGTERMLLLRSVSHDLRNPLHSINLAATTLLADDRHDPATRTRLLGLVVDESSRLDRIVENLLSLSRLQAGALVPDRRPVALDEIVDRVRDRYARLADHVSITTDGSLDVDVDVDAVQVDQLFTNLVDNAIRYVPDDVVVEFSAVVPPAAPPGTVVVDVRDNGPGFSDDLRRFGPAAFRSEGGSSGLGLTVCEAIAEAHGGGLELTGHPDGGALVRVRLPLSPADPEPT